MGVGVGVGVGVGAGEGEGEGAGVRVHRTYSTDAAALLLLQACVREKRQPEVT